MTITYAIADLHGRFDLLQSAYAEIAKRPPGKIVHLGDYVDRGPQSREIIEFLMDDATVPAFFERYVLRGNHEEIMYLSCATAMGLDWWISNGGGRTLISYGQEWGEMPNRKVVPQEHLQWIFALPYMHIDEHRVYVHAGVDPTVDLDKQEKEDLTWMRHFRGDERGHRGRHVVHGHTQHADGPKLYAGRTNLDTFAWYTGRLVIGVFDDNKPGGPTDTIEIIGEPHEQRMAA